MTLPVGLAVVTVQCGPYTDAQGAALSGTLYVRPSVQLVHAATGAVILDSPVRVDLDATGVGVVVLPATDAAALTATGWSYVVAFSLRAPDGSRPARPAFSFQLPASAPSVDLDLLAPVESASGVTVALPSVVSVAGLSGSVSAAALAAVLSPLVTPPVVTLTAGTGLTGGGALSADRTVALSAGSQASLALADTAVQPAAMTAAISAAVATIDGGSA